MQNVVEPKVVLPPPDDRGRPFIRGNRENARRL
jgi:hypothetical protein